MNPNPPLDFWHRFEELVPEAAAVVADPVRRDRIAALFSSRSLLSQPRDGPLTRASSKPPENRDLIPSGISLEPPGDQVSLSLEPFGEAASPLPFKEGLEPRSDGPHPLAPLSLPARYTYRNLIGRGGMGEVHRVFDRYLNRTVALKVIRADREATSDMISRFLSEAQATAQLQHPGIIPVHDIGRLNDGRHYFAMKEVCGQTLKAVIREVHAASPGNHWEVSDCGWSFRRLMHTFLKVCEAIAYAHKRGVVHRDLKPSNIMVGRYGEVLVMDWGLAKVAGYEERVGVEEALQPVQTLRTKEGAEATRVGRIAGTVAYMPPEQAAGEIGRLGPASDVYSLGAVLYEILSDRPAFWGADESLLLAQVREGAWRGPRRGLYEERTAGSASRVEGGSWSLTVEERREREGPPLPEELVAVCERAMSREPERRYGDGEALAKAVEAWLAQTHRRERGLAALAQVSHLPERIKRLRVKAREAQKAAEALLAKVPSWESIEKKKPGWALEDEAKRLLREADLETIAYTQGVRGALTQDEDLAEAHAALAQYYQAQHQAAEAERETEAVVQWEVLLKAHDRTKQYAAYLKGDGAVSLVTDPVGAEVTLYRYETVERRLVPKFVRELGRTPIRQMTLEKGSYLLMLRAPGRQEVRYPVFIERESHWDGVAPGETEGRPIYLPKAGELGPEDIYVPAGWFWCGGDDEAPNSLARQRVWVDTFVMRKYPVRNREYLDFLNQLLKEGGEEEALRWAPRERSGIAGQEGALSYHRADDYSFELGLDADGDVWLPDIPVVQVDWASLRAFSRSEARLRDERWRLPRELEWEKGARGVDGRWYPWGDSLDSSWVCIRASHNARPLPVSTETYPIDESVYGIRAMGGNIREWCADVYRQPESLEITLDEQNPDNEPRVFRGGYWLGDPRDTRCAARVGFQPGVRYPILGGRLTRSL